MILSNNGDDEQPCIVALVRKLKKGEIIPLFITAAFGFLYTSILIQLKKIDPIRFQNVGNVNKEITNFLWKVTDLRCI